MRFEITGLLIFPLKTKSAYFFFKNKKIQGPPGAEGPKGYNGPRGERGSPVCFNKKRDLESCLQQTANVSLPRDQVFPLLVVDG